MERPSKRGTGESSSRLHSVLYRLYRSVAGTSATWRRRITPAGTVTAIMLGMSAVVGLDTNRSTAYQVFTLLAAMVFFSIIYNYFFRPNLRVTRDCPRFASAGTKFSYQVTVENLKKRRYRSISLREALKPPVPERAAFLSANEPGEANRNRFDRTFLFYRWMWLVEKARSAWADESGKFSLTPRGKAVVSVEIEPLKRGVLQLADCRVLRPDAFGLIKSQRHTEDSGAKSVTVLPKRYQLPPISLEGKSQYQPCGVALAGSVGQSEEFMGVREYRPGDPIRHFHWKSWARTGKPMVVEFEDEFFPRYALALDTFAEFDQHDIFEEAVSIAASFACTLDTKDSLLDLMFVGTEAYCFTSGRGTSQPERLLEILASVDLCKSRPFESLDILIRTHSRELSACICIFIQWDEARQKCLDRLRSQGIDLLALVVCAPGDPRAKEGQGDGVHFMESDRIAEGLAKL